MSWLGRRPALYRSALASVSPLRASVPARAFTSRVGTEKPKGVRTLSTTASLGFSLLGLFSARSVSDVLGTSESSSIVREASPAAMNKQPYTLVFVSSTEWGVPRDKWQSWILYFREAGYDCIDLKVECPNERPEGKTPQDLLAARTFMSLTLEIAEQVRLSSLQRQPVLFLRGSADTVMPSYLGHGGLFTSTRNPMSGLVLLHPTSKEALQQGDWPSGTPVLVVPEGSNASSWEGVVPARNAKVLGDEWHEKEGLIKEVENWLRYQGL